MSKHLFPPRPTFIFLKGSTKVDQVRGANKAYVYHRCPALGWPHSDPSIYTGHWSPPSRNTQPVRDHLHFLVRVVHWEVPRPRSPGLTLVDGQILRRSLPTLIPKFEFFWAYLGHTLCSGILDRYSDVMYRLSDYLVNLSKSLSCLIAEWFCPYCTALLDIV